MSEMDALRSERRAQWGGGAGNGRERAQSAALAGQEAGQTYFAASSVTSKISVA